MDCGLDGDGVGFEESTDYGVVRESGFVGEGGEEGGEVGEDVSAGSRGRVRDGMDERRRRGAVTYSLAWLASAAVADPVLRTADCAEI